MRILCSLLNDWTRWAGCAPVPVTPAWILAESRKALNQASDLIKRENQNVWTGTLACAKALDAADDLGIPPCDLGPHKDSGTSLAHRQCCELQASSLTGAPHVR